MKLPVSGYAFYMRTVVPGIAATILFYPLLRPLLTALQTTLGSGTVPSVVYFVALALGLGILFQFFHVYIYRSFEGYWFWNRAAEWWRRRLEKRLSEKVHELECISLELQDRPSDADLRARYTKLQQELMTYPVSSEVRYQRSGEVGRYVPSATRLGTVILEYEG